MKKKEEVQILQNTMDLYGTSLPPVEKKKVWGWFNFNRINLEEAISRVRFPQAWQEK